MTTDSITCPHCTVDNPSAGQFCESCGMALPSLVATGPRIVDGKGFASTTAGQELQSRELQKLARKAAGALLAVAVIQTALFAFIVFLVQQKAPNSNLLANPVLLGMGATVLIFWGLYVWARVQPLPAAIVGLVLYVTLKVINIVLIISQTSRSSSRNGGFQGIGVGWLDIVIIAVLAQAISASLKYRKMMQAGATA